ncbi:DUF2752 domain-containing protein [Planotetraspora phitsanulokensis]|uniref:Membrane protein n=1 Tax=Planotetraspora phitsanulokensis TaxID=575192 RepID=A0A8J3U3J3_9ACTN|nr:DUF2752 domain-containing protein [Planotetraspora phitsanulokensis]GII35444.1 membrane protein [Planotetraspora phitsanulokensis]
MTEIVPARRGVDRLRSVLPPLGVAALTGAAFAYVSAVDPNQPGHYPTCPFLFLTGFYCPGCGALRAMHALGHADLVSALGFNPFAVATLPFLVFWWGRWALRSWQGRPVRTSLAHPAYIWALFVAVILFGVLRNTPFGQFLAP